MRADSPLAVRTSAAFAVVALITATIAADHAYPHGAIAVGVGEDVARDGLAIGAAWDMPDAETARQQALQQCRALPGTPPHARARCEITRTFSRMCIAAAFDPDSSTAGWGWAVAPTQAEAEARAVRFCKRGMLQFCIVKIAGCDVKP